MQTEKKSEAVSNPERAWSPLGWLSKKVPLYKRLILQPLMPPFLIPEPFYGKRCKTEMDLKETSRKPQDPGNIPKTKFEVFGEEMIEKEVKPSGNSGRVYLPLDWVVCTSKSFASIDLEGEKNEVRRNRG